MSQRINQTSGETTWGSLLSCALICATVVFVAYFLAPPRPEHRRLWIPVVIGTNGTWTVMGETRQMEFWTPSVHTKDYLHKEGGEVIAREKWQVVSNDDVVTQFGALLHANPSVFGYRRYEVWGQGGTIFKPGWWWTMSVSTDFSVVDLAQTYQQYWKSAQPLRVEVIDNRGIKDK
jgi:hypothetical protein